MRWFTTVAIAAVSLGAVNAQAQAVITGRINSEQGQELEGANVYITELNVSVGTNAQGRYRITVPAERTRGQTVTLRVRSIGFAPQERNVVVRDGEQTVDFTLKLDVQRLSAVVTTGVTAGTEQTKLPFKVASVDSADMPVPATNPLTQLQGKVPGATILSATGRPGAAPAVVLRGPTAINAAGRSLEPLYIVDGVILNGPLPDINPLDIESVEVVKGAAASSLYGARAGNGVIQITTKSGKNRGDGVKFNARTEYGVSDVENRIPQAQRHSLVLDETGTRFCQNVTGQAMCNVTMDYHMEQLRSNNAPGDFAGAVPGFPVDPGSGPQSVANLKNRYQIEPWPVRTYDAIDQFVRPKPFYQNSLDMTGRFGKTSVFTSASNLTQGGAVRFLDGFRRNSVRLNVDQLVGEDWTVAVRTFYSQSKADGRNQDNANNAFFQLTRVPPIVNLLQRDTLGRLFIRPNLQGGGQQNANALNSLEFDRRLDKRDRFLGGVTLRYAPLDWLDLEGNFSYDYANLEFSQFRDKGFRTTTANAGTNNGFLFKGSNNSQSYNSSMNATLRYDLFTDLRTRTSFRYLYEQQDDVGRDLQGNLLAVQGVDDASNITGTKTIDSFNESIRQIGLFAGLNLEYRERYIVDLLIRRDGSSLFGSDDRWQTFGRGSAAWRVAAEPWWFVPQINELKLRASRGTAGGRPRFNAQYETYTIGAGGVVSPQQTGNKFLRPEVITENEIGLDLGLFDRVTFELTYAYAEARDQILPITPSAWTGFANKWENAGTLENRTLEMALSVPVLTTRDFSWTVRGTFDRTRTMISKLNVPPFNFGATQQATDQMFRAEEGRSLGTFYGRYFMTNCSQLPTNYQATCGGPTSAFQVNDDGFLVYVGEGHSWRDGVSSNLWNTYLPACPIGSPSCQTAATSPYVGIRMHWGMPITLRDTLGVAQVVPLGNALPKYKWAFSQNASFKRLTGYMLIDATVGHQIFNQGRMWSYLDFLHGDQDQAGKTAETAKPYGYYWRTGVESSGVGGFYDILGPNNQSVENGSYAKLREAMLSYRVGAIGGMGDWSVSLVGRNLHTWTKYSGFDPEVGAPTGQSSSAIVNAVDAFTFPNVRTFTFGLNTSF